MGAATTREIKGDPAKLPTLLKAALPVVPGIAHLPGIKRSGSALPELTLSRHDVAVDRDHLAAYSEVCGFGLAGRLPLTYPHVLGHPLHMAILTDRHFPFPAVGLVHVENSITAHRAISAGESLRVTVRPADLRPHPRGRVFDLVTEVHSGDELVWEETSTMLRKGRPSADAQDSAREFAVVPSSGTEWRLPGDLGRRYAAVSGDVNPIHMYALTAKAFGFPRQIAHGMWSTARCLAALEGRLPDAVTVDVAFRKPVLLPGTVAFGSTVRSGSDTGRNRDYAFSLTNPKTGAPHLVGRTSAA